MPELPEVEAVCRRLRESVRDWRVVKAKVERPSVSAPQAPELFSNACNGRSITQVERVGKNVILHLDGGGHFLRIHLRMTGNLYVVPDIRFRVHTVRAWLRMEDGTAIVFDDPRCLGKIHVHDAAELGSLLAEIGPEPSRIAVAEFAARARKTRKAIKLFLMDQKHVSGLGNIYAAEALFRARIHPGKLASSLSRPRLARLHQACVEVLEEAKESAYRAYAEPGSFAEGESFPVAVYGRQGEPCPVCGKPVHRIAQGSRSTYFCPRCQRS